MALDRIVDRPRFGLRRRMPDLVAVADSARDASQWELAAQLYRRALDRSPDNPPIWVQYGHALKESGELRDPDKLAQAELAYRRALSFDPGVADSYVQLGHVLKLQGNTNEAEASYLRAFTLDPSMSYPLQELSGLGWSEAQLSELQGMLSTARLNAQPDGWVPPATRPRVHIPDLSELRQQKPRGRIAVVLHLFDPDLWNEMREAIERILHPFDLFVSLTRGASDHMRDAIMQAFPNAWIFDFEDRGRDIGPFLVFLQSGVLSRYDLVCKLHTKRSPHIHAGADWVYPDGDTWRRALIAGVLGSSHLVDQIVARFRSDPELGMVVGDGNIFRGHEYWINNEQLLAELLPRMGISPEVRDRSFPGGSIFWIRSSLLGPLARAGFRLDDFDPEPLDLDGGLGHAIERMFGLLCEQAGMRVIEHGQLAETEAALSEFQAAPPTHDKVINDKEIISHEFDRDYYVDAYPDIDPAGVDPLDHFCTFGWREGRNPCDWFSTTYYLDIHKDVARTGTNPFVHYLSSGRAEGRQIASADAAKGRDLELDPNASLVSDLVLLDILRFPSRTAITAQTSFDPKSMDIHWVILEFGVGQGGHMTIFRIIRWLEIFGHRCTIWINHPGIHSSSLKAFEDITRHYQPIRSDVRFVADGFLDASGDVVIATGWQTVQIVSHAQKFKDRFYFVQDYESTFYSRGTLSILAELTYLKDLACICCGSWLEGIMRDRYGRWARHFWLAADDSIYFRSSNPRPANRVPKIAFYGRIGTSWRAVELGLLGLQHLASQSVAFHVDLYGGDLHGGRLDVSRAPFSCTLHGTLKPEELGELYRAADLGLCFSTTNYSIVPQEMMACGLPVVEIDVESTRAIYPEGVVTFCGPQPHEIADAIGSLLRDPDRRRRQAEAAIAWVSSFSWERSARMVEAALCDHLSERGYRCPTRLMTSAGAAAQIKASVFIPTYNGGTVFKTVIDMVRSQRSPWKFEIIVIDSSSSDGTGDFCRGATDIVFEQIAQSEFSHGGTRNRGVELAQGAFVAFLTQDAVPIDEFWLYNLVSLLEAYPNAAGAFGRHVAWPNDSPFIKRDLTEHFKHFHAFPIAVSKETDPGRWASGDAGWRQFLHFYSDNNSCMRRSVWKTIPLPNISYGEDQVWANQIIEAGYQKVYAHTATVYHSHDYDYDATQARAEEEAIFFKVNFGYELINVKEDFEVTLARINETDTRWARRHEVSEPDLRKRLHLNKARLEGYFSGYRKCSTSLPGNQSL